MPAVRVLLQQGSRADVPDRWNKTANDYAIELLKAAQATPAAQKLDTSRRASGELDAMQQGKRETIVRLLQEHLARWLIGPADQEWKEAGQLMQSEPHEIELIRIDSDLDPLSVCIQTGQQAVTREVPAQMLPCNLVRMLQAEGFLPVSSDCGAVEPYDFVVCCHELRGGEDINHGAASQASLVSAGVKNGHTLTVEPSPAKRAEREETAERKQLTGEILFCCAEMQLLELKTILQSGTTVVVQDYDQRTPLHVACAVKAHGSSAQKQKMEMVRGPGCLCDVVVSGRVSY